jgi:hypothetical protein
MELGDALKGVIENVNKTDGLPPAPVAADPIVADPITQPVTTDPTPKFDIQKFNEFTKTFGKEFKDEDEIKGLFSYPAKYTELENNFNLTKKEKEELDKKYNEVGKFIDPKDFFANEALYKSNQMLLKFPDKDPVTMMRISNMDLSKTKDVDLIVANERLVNPEIYEGRTDQQILDYLSTNEYEGIDFSDPDTWDENTKIKIAKETKKIRSEFKSLQSVELPQKVDVEGRKADLLAQESQKYEQSKIKLSAFADKVLADNTELAIPDPDDGTELYKFKPEVTSDMKSDMADYIDELAKKGEDLSNPVTVNKILRRREEIITHSELPKILKAHSMKIATAMELKYHDKIHNDSPLSTNTAPVTDQSAQVSETVRKIQQMM